MSSIATTKPDSAVHHPKQQYLAPLANTFRIILPTRTRRQTGDFHKAIYPPKHRKNPKSSGISKKSWIGTFQKWLGKIPAALLDTKLRDYTFKYIMQWVLRDPNVKIFDPEIFKARGYKVEKIPNNHLLHGNKFLILPEKIRAEPLVIIHGARTTAKSMGGCTQAALNKGHPVIVGDIAGFGSNQHRFSVDAIQNDVRGLFNFAYKKFNKPFSIFAHSYGTYNATNALKSFLTENPEAKIRNLILISPWCDLYDVAKDLWQTDASGKKKIETIANSNKVDSYTRSFVKAVSDKQLELIRGFADTEKAFFKLASSKLQNRIEKVFITYGKQDRHVKPIFSKTLAKRLSAPNMGFKVVEKPLSKPDADHFDVTNSSSTKSAGEILAMAA